jgi:hypothetical protein
MSIKHILIFAIFVILAITSYAQDVYVAGYFFNSVDNQIENFQPVSRDVLNWYSRIQETQFEVAAYWKNGEKHILTNYPSFAHSIFVSGADVYIVGSVATMNRDREIEYHATLWKNGVAQTLPIGSRANSVFVSGSDVYVIGQRQLWLNGTVHLISNEVSNAISLFVRGNTSFIVGEEFAVTSRSGAITRGTRRYTLWRDGISQTLPNNFIPESVFASGEDVFVSGNIDLGTDRTGFRNTNASIWKNGELQTLSRNLSVANGVFVSGTDVYVAGYERVQVFAVATFRATIWKNGVAQHMDANASADAVFVHRNDVFAVGSVTETIEDQFGFQTRNTRATLWRNGVPQTLGGNSVNSYATSVFVIN